MIQVKNDITGLKRQVEILRFFWDNTQSQFSIDIKVHFLNQLDEPITVGRFAPYEEMLLIQGEDYTTWHTAMQEEDMVNYVQNYVVDHFENEDLPELDEIEI